MVFSMAVNELLTLSVRLVRESMARKLLLLLFDQ